MRPFVVSMMLMLGISGWSVNASAAKFYRWVDAQGQVHFSDLPHARAKTLHLHLSKPTASQADQTPALDNHDAAACKQATQQLARYRHASTITETDALGRSHVLSKAQRKKLVDRTQAKVKKACRTAS